MPTNEPSTRHLPADRLRTLREASSGDGVDDEPKTTLFFRRGLQEGTPNETSVGPAAAPRARLGKKAPPSVVGAKAMPLTSEVTEQGRNFPGTSQEPATRIEASRAPMSKGRIEASDQTPVVERVRPSKNRLWAFAIASVAIGVLAVAVVRWRMSEELDATLRPTAMPNESVSQDDVATGEDTWRAVEAPSDPSPESPDVSSAPQPKPVRTDPGPSAKEPTLPDQDTQRRRAVELLVSGHDAEALDMYRALSRSAPHEKAYALIARLLERDLESCEGEGTSCAK